MRGWAISDKVTDSPILQTKLAGREAELMAEENTDNAQSNESNGKTEPTAPSRDEGGGPHKSVSVPWDAEPQAIKEELDKKNWRRRTNR